MVRALVLNARWHVRGGRFQWRTNATSSAAASQPAHKAVCSDHENDPVTACGDISNHVNSGRESCLQEVTAVVKAALTSGSLSALGDILAQVLVQRQLKKGHNIDKQFELERTARMFSFGFLLYGPFQHYWYRTLANWFPGTGLRSFGIKVGLNQVVLGPLVLGTAFSWNLALQQQADQIPAKIKKDMFPTLVNGWKFWVPAACFNFFWVPVNYQVLWMSLCGVLWTGYISFASYNSANAITIKQ